MQFKLTALALLLLINVGYLTNALAASNPPLDVIELLGEIGDESMLAAALNELDKKPIKNQKINSTQPSSKQSADTATPAGGNKK